MATKKAIITVSGDTERAPVQVLMPEVRLTVSDLAYMTGLLPGATRCIAHGAATDRLVFLGMIEMGDIPPCPDKVKEYEDGERKARTELKSLIRSGNWDAAWRLASNYNYQHGRKPEAKKDFILTKAGLEFIKKGRALSVPSAKGGCVK